MYFASLADRLGMFGGLSQWPREVVLGLVIVVLDQIDKPTFIIAPITIAPVIVRVQFKAAVQIGQRFIEKFHPKLGISQTDQEEE